MLIDIDKIVIPERARKTFPNIEKLAASIGEIGLIHPPTITHDFKLIAGERRIRAMKHLGYKQVEVHVMTVESDIHHLKMERDENDNRENFTFSEAVSLGRRIEEKELTKAKERREAGVRENFPQGKTGRARDIVAEAIGFGSGKQYEKAKFIADNADPETIEQLDNKEISIHAAYKKIKDENARLEEEIKKLKDNPETVTVEVEKVVDKTDYSAITNMKQELDSYTKKYRDTLTELNEKNQMVSKFMGESTDFKLVSSTSEITMKMHNFLKEMSQYDYLSDVFNDVPDATRKEYIRSINGVYKWARNILESVRHEDVFEVDTRKTKNTIIDINSN